ncbi:hypothetical protein U472_11450 [Orenia metallireducens]|uniref:NAD glycohydrolase translocation F5/8 type C domain-containing protein n=1 Tax=Orenia metallireducens TaxID=1413210 RepID=A0A1C0A8J8_9FIRM|nr:hypothetical protein [Orenia metallireducens]OCL26593.1 hypothetical protein U472_11450 [Orenia metallireducens]
MKRSFLIVIILTIIISSVAFAENYYPTMTLVQDLEYSSYLISNNQPKLAYHPVNLTDEDRRTAWFEGVEGSGVGEYIVFKFLRPINIEGINIFNGYGKSSKLFYANNRIKTLEIVINKSDKNTITVADVNKEQNIKFKAKNVSELKLIIRDIYKGEVYNDTGFSEISFLTNIENGKRNKDEKIIELFDPSGKIDFEKVEDKLKEDISPQIIKEVFERRYEGLDGAGNDDRLYFFLRAIKKQPSLIPPVLKVIYDKSDNGIFVSESANEDCYVWSIKYLLDDNLVSLPLIKHSGMGFYTTYYYTLELGDTRIIPKYLDKLIETGIWHEFSCNLMPHEIIIKEKDNYTEKIIKKYLNEKPMSKEVRGELKKVLENK